MEGAIRSAWVGSKEALRGFESRRFADKAKVLTNTELRRFLPSWKIKGQNLETQAILFADFGRVSPSPVCPNGGLATRI